MSDLKNEQVSHMVHVQHRIYDSDCPGCNPAHASGQVRPCETCGGPLSGPSAPFPRCIPCGHWEDECTCIRNDKVRLEPERLSLIQWFEDHICDMGLDELADTFLASDWLRAYVAERVAQAKVAALREAADNMPLNRPDQPYEHAAGWLRRRADAFAAASIRGGDAS